VPIIYSGASPLYFRANADTSKKIEKNTLFRTKWIADELTHIGAFLELLHKNPKRFSGNFYKSRLPEEPLLFNAYGYSHIAYSELAQFSILIQVEKPGK
jgi:hypothetical protein